MKKVILALFATFTALSTHAQGLVNLDTLSVDFKVGYYDRPFEPGFTAQLLQVQGGTLTPLFPTTTFFGTDFPEGARYYTLPVEVAVPGVSFGQNATLLLRVFGPGPLETARYILETSPFNVTLGGDIPGPALLDPLRGQSMLVPEPTNIALAILGTAALLLRRRP